MFEHLVTFAFSGQDFEAEYTVSAYTGIHIGRVWACGVEDGEVTPTQEMLVAADEAIIEHMVTLEESKIDNR